MTLKLRIDEFIIHYKALLRYSYDPVDIQLGSRWAPDERPMDARWTPDGLQMDARWTPDGYLFDIHWVKDNMKGENWSKNWRFTANDSLV